MKMNLRALFQVGKIECINTHFDPRTQSVGEYPADMVFVTPDIVERARPLEKSMRPVDFSRLPDLKFGDVLVMARRNEIKPIIEVVPVGRDAGVSLQLADGGRLPFTGRSMLSAYLRLDEMDRRGEALTADQAQALTGIRTIFHLVCAKPDPVRFAPTMIAHAFLSHLLSGPGAICASVDDEAIARKMRADMIRARIASLNPDHEDALGSSLSHARLLVRSGVEMERSGDLRVPSLSSAEEGMRRMILNNQTLRRDVFGSITTTPIDQLGASLLSRDQADIFLESNEDSLLSGAWLDRIATILGREFQAQMPGAMFDVRFLSFEGRDFLMLREAGTGINPRGQSFLYSWPSIDRVPATSGKNGHLINMSPEEIPSDAEIARLQAVHDDLFLRESLDEIASGGWRSRQTN